MERQQQQQQKNISLPHKQQFAHFFTLVANLRKLPQRNGYIVNDISLSISSTIYMF
jgi:hypothetical protein